MFSVTFLYNSPARSFLVFPKKAEEKAEVGPKTCSGLIPPSPAGIIRQKGEKRDERSRSVSALSETVQEGAGKARKAGKETLTDEEVERLALSATEEHEIMVAKNKENDLSNSQH